MKLSPTININRSIFGPGPYYLLGLRTHKTSRDSILAFGWSFVSDDITPRKDLRDTFQFQHRLLLDVGVPRIVTMSADPVLLCTDGLKRAIDSSNFKIVDIFSLDDNLHLVDHKVIEASTFIELSS